MSDDASTKTVWVAAGINLAMTALVGGILICTLASQRETSALLVRNTSAIEELLVTVSRTLERTDSMLETWSNIERKLPAGISH